MEQLYGRGVGNYFYNIIVRELILVGLSIPCTFA